MKSLKKYMISIMLGMLMFMVPAQYGLSITPPADYYVTIEKSADQTTVNLTIGQTITVNYTITLNVTDIMPVDGCYLPLASGQCVYVTDTLYGEFTNIICYSGGIGSYDFTYSHQVGPYENCGDYLVTNTACVQYNPIETPDPCCVSYDVYVHVPCDGGCTLTPGYWKTHSMYGPAPYDDTWALVGEDTPFFSSGLSVYEILWTPPSGGNAYVILAHAYIAAALNESNGASVPEDVDDALIHAKTLLGMYDISDRLSRTVRQDFILTAELLDEYNNGYIGPGHCTE
jgi:hypothetical protein